MAIKSTHPQYDKKKEDWQLCRDSFDGDTVVKDKGHEYLPPTPGQIVDGFFGGNADARAAYEAYKARAVFPDFFTMGVETLIGILNSKEAQIELPPELEYLRTEATLTGEGLGAVLRKVHEQQLITGRVGLLADLPVNPDQTNPKQYISLWNAETILNWDDGSFNDGFNVLNLVVLDESGYERMDGYEWREVKKYRVLTLGEVGENEPLGVYKSGVASETEDVNWVTPVLKGKSLDTIPFVFIGPKDMDITPDTPPLLGLARLCMVIYRGEADYRFCLFMQGQDTLVVVGGMRADATTNQDSIRVGAGARIDVDQGGDAKYVGVGGDGLAEQRMALEADRSLAAVRTGQLLAPGKMSMESGEALKTRVAAQTATLTSVAIAGAAGLEQALRKMAKWQGADPAKVKVSPNLDFTNVAIAGQDIVQLLTAKNLGAPLSYQTIFEVLKDHGLTRNDFETEMELIRKDPKELVELAKALVAPPQANNPTQSAGGPKKTPDAAPIVSNKPKK